MFHGKKAARSPLAAHLFIQPFAYKPDKAGRLQYLYARTERQHAYHQLGLVALAVTQPEYVPTIDGSLGSLFKMREVQHDPLERIALVVYCKRLA